MSRSKTPAQHRDAWVKEIRALLSEISEIPAREWAAIQEESTRARDGLLFARDGARECVMFVGKARGEQ